MRSIYKKAKQELTSEGINFKKDVYELSSQDKELLESSAKEYGYKIASGGNSSLGYILHARYYLMLQRVK